MTTEELDNINRVRDEGDVYLSQLILAAQRAKTANMQGAIALGAAAVNPIRPITIGLDASANPITMPAAERVIERLDVVEAEAAKLVVLSQDLPRIIQNLQQSANLIKSAFQQ